MVPLVRSVFLIYTACEQKNPISPLQELAGCHEKALQSLWPPQLRILTPLPFCDLACTFRFRGVTFSAGNPLALESHQLPITEKRTAAVLAVKPPQTYQRVVPGCC